MNSDTTQYAFECESCGATTIVESDNGPESLKGRVFACSDCGENTLLDNYVGNRNE